MDSLREGIGAMIGEGSGLTVGLVLAMMMLGLIVWGRLEGRFNSERGERKALEKELNDLKLHVERNFVSAEFLEKTETRLINAVERLSGRLETLISRVEKLTTDFARSKVSNPQDMG